MVKVSVIIPIYNVQEYIEECLVSAMRQTLQDIEIICVNDGTKDNSMDIVYKLAEEDERIIIIEKENGGLSSARNAGLEKASGEYVYFLDSDDYIAENMLEYLYAECVQGDLDNIYFDAESFFENEELEKQYRHYKDYYRRPSMFNEIVSGPQLFADMENKGFFRPSACLQMPRRDLLLKHHIFFYDGIVHEDNLFSLLVIFSAQRVRTESTMTDDQEFKRSYGYYVCITEFIKYILQFDFEDKDIIKAIVHRCYVMQGNAAKAIKNLPLDELDDLLSQYPMETQIQYSIFVKRLIEVRRVQGEKYTLLKEKSAENMEETPYLGV